MRRLKIKLECGICGEEWEFKDSLDWGTSLRKIFICPNCGYKGVLDVGLHAPEDVNISESTPINYDLKDTQKGEVIE